MGSSSDYERQRAVYGFFKNYPDTYKRLLELVKSGETPGMDDFEKMGEAIGMKGLSVRTMLTTMRTRKNKGIPIDPPENLPPKVRMRTEKQEQIYRRDLKSFKRNHPTVWNEFKAILERGENLTDACKEEILRADGKLSKATLVTIFSTMRRYCKDGDDEDWEEEVVEEELVAEERGDGDDYGTDDNEFAEPNQPSTSEPGSKIRMYNCKTVKELENAYRMRSEGFEQEDEEAWKHLEEVVKRGQLLNKSKIKGMAKRYKLFPKVIKTMLRIIREKRKEDPSRDDSPDRTPLVDQLEDSEPDAPAEHRSCQEEEGEAVSTPPPAEQSERRSRRVIGTSELSRRPTVDQLMASDLILQSQLKAFSFYKNHQAIYQKLLEWKFIRSKWDSYTKIGKTQNLAASTVRNAHFSIKRLKSVGFPVNPPQSVKKLGKHFKISKERIESYKKRVDIFKVSHEECWKRLEKLMRNGRQPCKQDVDKIGRKYNMDPIMFEVILSIMDTLAKFEARRIGGEEDEQETDDGENPDPNEPSTSGPPPDALQNRPTRSSINRRASGIRRRRDDGESDSEDPLPRHQQSEPRTASMDGDLPEPPVRWNRRDDELEEPSGRSSELQSRRIEESGGNDPFEYSGRAELNPNDSLESSSRHPASTPSVKRHYPTGSLDAPTAKRRQLECEDVDSTDQAGSGVLSEPVEHGISQNDRGASQLEEADNMYKYINDALEILHNSLNQLDDNKIKPIGKSLQVNLREIKRMLNSSTIPGESSRNKQYSVSFAIIQDIKRCFIALGSGISELPVEERDGMSNVLKLDLSTIGEMLENWNMNREEAIKEEQMDVEEGVQVKTEDPEAMEQQQQFVTPEDQPEPQIKQEPEEEPVADSNC